MRALLDINVLIALFDADHPHHTLAASWLKDNIRLGWASCPLTQNGCLRVMAQPGYPNPAPVSQMAERLREAARHSAHRFWPDEPSLLDPALVDLSRVHGPRQITDTYLLLLAVRNKGRFVTFDAGVALASVRGARKDQLVVLV